MDGTGSRDRRINSVLDNIIQTTKSYTIKLLRITINHVKMFTLIPRQFSGNYLVEINRSVAGATHCARRRFKISGSLRGYLEHTH